MPFFDGAHELDHDEVSPCEKGGQKPLLGQFWQCASPVEFVSPFFGQFFCEELIKQFYKNWFSMVLARKIK